MAHSLLANQWQLYVGILVESTTYKNQRWFHVFVPEFLPTKMGDVSAENIPVTVSMFNQKTEKNEEIDIDLTSTIYAEYFGITTSMDVPDMYRGMQVLVMNRSTTDKWYWIPLERDDSYKTFEHVRMSCADECLTNKTPDAEKDDIETRDKGLTDDNTYFFEIDTKDKKHVLLSTSASDGEEWRYFFKIDAEAHTVELWDNCVDGSQPNNTIKIESRPDPATRGRITLQNASGNTIIMQGEDTMINIPRNLIVNIGGDTQINGVGNVSTHILKNLTSIVDMNKVTTTNGSVNTTIMQNNVEVVQGNQSVTIGQVHNENQKVRTTVAVDAMTTGTKTYNVGAASTTFSFGSWTCMCTTISMTAAQTWSLICKKWKEVAESVGGTVVALIRGGHH
ncbi:MAG: hypothetical protein IKA36_06230 [Clostridia bacterium]|nr:hypothetical protein [Clostridia bacterium]